MEFLIYASETDKKNNCGFYHSIPVGSSFYMCYYMKNKEVKMENPKMHV